MQLSLRVAALALLLSCGCSVPPDDRGTRTIRSAITAGQATDAWPAVVVLAVGAARCTAVVIADDAVLTAAHCVSGVSPERARVTASIEADGETTPARSIQVHPDYDPDTLANDIAIVRVQRALGIMPLPLHRRSMDAAWIGRHVSVVGYGRTSAEDAASGIKRIGTSVVTAVSSAEITLGPAPNRPCVGDSGGPAIADVEGVPTVVALTSGGDDACTGIARDIRIDVHQEFVSTALSPAGPETGCAVGGPRRVTAEKESAAVVMLVLSTCLRRRGSGRRRRHEGDNRCAG